MSSTPLDTPPRGRKRRRAYRRTCVRLRLKSEAQHPPKARRWPASRAIWGTPAERDTVAMERIRLLLVDDEPTVRRGLRMRLQLEPDVEVIGEAGDGLNAVELATQLKPSVVLMDIEMPLMDGIQAAAAIGEGSSGAAVVMLSLHDDAATVARARKAGAAGFVAKHRMDDGLLTAIRRAAGRNGAPAP